MSGILEGEKPILRNEAIYGYFRLGLVTGIVTRQEVIEWADRQILGTPIPDTELIELSLSSRLPHSQLIRLLNIFQGTPDYELPPKMLLARAGIILDSDPRHAGTLLSGLRLLNAEEYLPKEIRLQLAYLESLWESVRLGKISPESLPQKIGGLLQPYQSYRHLVNEIG